ncbi:MAG TPA: ABC transporter substrate-binding protein [Pseudonocardiaceae bacterium]|jgi:ribose transport system substrate-binding protein|nr:ABC transporter substrate-binding protein [Pseudonocardiaceae bacterium]
MQRKSRVILMIGSVVAAGALIAACGGSGQIGGSGGGSAAATPSNKNLVYIPGDIEPFYNSIDCSAKAEASKLGYNLTQQGSGTFAVDSQTPIVNAVANTKPAGVLIAPTDPDAMLNPIKGLTSAGTKVVEVDTALTDASATESSVSSNNVQGGKLAADTLAKLLGGKKGSVLVLNTTAGTSTTVQREQGFDQEIKKYPNLTVLPQQFTNNLASQATSVLTDELSAHPDLVGVFATNLNTGQGAAAALQSAGDKGKVDLIGFDASPQEVTSLQQGVFQGLIAQDPAQIGIDGVDQVVNAIEGKPVTKTIATNLISLTAADTAEIAKYTYKASACS